MLYFVSVYYSWSSEHPLYAFATKDEALEFMRHDYERENIQATKSDNELIVRSSIDAFYATVTLQFGFILATILNGLSKFFQMNCRLFRTV